MSVLLARSASFYPNVQPTTTRCSPAIFLQNTVPVGDTVNIDVVPTTDFLAAKWYVVITTNSGSRTRSYELYATHNQGLSPIANMYAMIGNSIAHVPDVTISSGNLNFEITNNDTEDLLVYVTRIAVTKKPVDYSGDDIVEISNSDGLVRANQTATIDFIDTDLHIGAKWLVTVTNTSGVTSATQIFSLPDLGVLTTYGYINQAQLEFTVSVNVVPSLGVELTLTNLTNSHVRVDMTRIPIQTQTLLDSCGSFVGLPLTLPVSVSINGNQTAVIDDGMPISLYTYAKWLAVVVDAVNNKTQAFEFTSLVTQGSSTDVMYGIIADSIDITMTTSIVANQLTLSVTNNQTTAIQVYVLRTPVIL